jgi:TonB family protein
MTHAQSWILSYLVNSLWQLPLLCAAGCLAARALRPIGPAAEHRAWVSVLVLQALLPALPALPAGWLPALLSWISPPAHPPADGNVSVVFGPGAALGGFHLPATLLAIAAIAYALSILYFLARFAWRCLRLASIRRNSSQFTLSPSQSVCLARAQRTFAVHHVSLRASQHLAVPVTLGLARSVILLPAALAPALSDSDFRTVIEHECAHIRRRDFARNLVYELLSLPISYHPLLRLTRERIAETREMICDQLAAQHTGAIEYGRSLLRLASLLVTGRPAPKLHAIGIFDSHTLERRLMRLKQNPTIPPGARRLVLITACTLLAVATCASALTLHMSVKEAKAGSSKPNPQLVHVRPDIMAAQILTKVTPKYPEDAKKAHIQGVVTLKAIIGKDGAVDRLSVLSGPAPLQQSSLVAVRQWTYKPFLFNGQPVEVETTINVHYSLSK